MLRYLGLNPLLNVLPRDGTLGLENHVRADSLLGVERVLYAHYRGIGDGKVGEENSLEFCGGDLEARDFDEFLWTVQNHEKTGGQAADFEQSHL